MPLLYPQSSCHHPSWIEIDLGQFCKNIELIRRYISPRLFCLPVKANAYGHGLSVMSDVAAKAGVDYLGVAHLREGAELRQSGITIPILVMGAIHEDQIPELLAHNLEFTISSLYKARLVALACEKIGKPARVHLEVDTGMQRTGVRAKTALEVFAYLKSNPNFDIVGIYSHLATADQENDPFAAKQIQLFTDLLANPIFAEAKLIRHLANSGGVSHYSAAHLDMVRPSMLTFGYPSFSMASQLQGISPCFSLKSKVSYFKVVEPGTGISYGHSYITPTKTRIVTIPIGYGDGYRRSLSNRGQVIIRGRRFPIVGTICMDQFMVDVGQHEVHVGDEVVLIGRQGAEEITLLEIAQLCDTIPYEILCQFNDRLPRIYKN